MSQYVYTMESVNLICGDIGDEAQPGVSTHLTLREMKLPNLEENYVDHVGGGAVAAIEIYSHMNKLESTFKLAGWQPAVMGQLARSVRALQRYTFYGLIREQRTGQALKATGLIWGRMGNVSPSAFRRGDLMEHDYSIKSITHYELYMEISSGVSSRLFYWDFFENRLEVGNVNVRAEENAILGIAGTTPGAETNVG
jgi:phage tail tube protein FII